MSFFSTCKPTGEPEIKLTYCLTGIRNRKSLPGAQIEIIECGPYEMCTPVSPSEDMVALGYVFLGFDTSVLQIFPTKSI